MQVGKQINVKLSSCARFEIFTAVKIAGVAQSIEGLGYGLDEWGSIPGRENDAILSLHRPYRVWCPPSLLSNVYWVSHPGGKAAEA
jgi:hypothetical protein